MKLLGFVAAVALTAPSAVMAGTYAQHLADLERARHPEITEITATPKDPATPIKPAAGAAKSFDLELRDVSHDPIGVLSFTFKSAAPGNQRLAEGVQKALSRHLISAKNGLDPYPYDATHSENTFSQALVDRTFARHPEVIILAIHSTPPGEATNIISGSTIGRIGKKADEDDLRVIEKGATNLEVAENGKRFEVELPLNDARGHRIGALGIVFAYKAGDDKETLHRRGIRIRDEMAKSIPTAAALAKPR